MLPHGVELAIKLVAGEINKIRRQRLIIAVDGHSSSGKSTLAKDLAFILELTHIDSGAMYRAVTHYALSRQILIGDPRAIEDTLPDIQIEFKKIGDKTATFLNGHSVEEQIRSMKVSEHVSDIAAISAVRTFLVEQQRELAKQGGIIMDGRDIGSVVFPNADVKLFVTASTEVRTERRYLELTQKGITITKEEVRQNLLKRDHIDSTRADSPLVQASDAHSLDTSDMDRGQMAVAAIQLIFNKVNRSLA